MMYRTLFSTAAVFSACVILSACGGIVSVRDSDLETIEEELKNARQQQALLAEKLDTFAAEQKVTTAEIRSEIAKTQNLMSESLGIAASPSNPEGSTRQSINRAQWLREEGKLMIGSLEYIALTEPNITYAARIDTGATSSSIDARDIVRFERDGDSWIRFKLYSDENNYEELEHPIVRWVRIYQSGTDEGERRPVVEMSYKIGDIEDIAEFTLTDRSHLEFTALIGRNIMKDMMIVDISRSFILDRP